MAFDTSARDAAVRREPAHREELRLRAFTKTREALDELAEELGIRRAYLFGSVVRKGGFRPDSDVDIAVEGTDEVIAAAARLSRHIGREVHVVELGDTPVARRARREGVEWIPRS